MQWEQKEMSVGTNTQRKAFSRNMPASKAVPSQS